MWWVFLLLVPEIVSSSEQDRDATLGEFEARLHDEAIKMYSQRAEEMSRPPTFHIPSDFMRSFIPDTGVGNREELVIGNIRQIPFFHDTNFTQWQYKRFNNTDYILGVRSRHVVLNKIDPSIEDYFTFILDEDVVFNFVADPRSIVIDVAIFTRIYKRSTILYVAILTESALTSMVNIYEIIEEKGVPVASIDLGITSSLGNFAAKKLSFVHSQYGESLVVLIDTSDVSQVLYQQKGSNELNYFIAVYYPSASDVVTFTVHGHGYIAVANATTCDIFKLDNFAGSHVLFDRLHIPSTDSVELEYFRLGFHHYLAVSGKSSQHLYIWKSGEFMLKQLFGVANVNQLYSSTLPTCRDDVILFFISDENVEIYVYSGKTDTFVPSNAVIPSGFRIYPGTIAAFTYKHNARLVFLNPEGEPTAFTIETSLESIPNPVLVAGQEISEYMKSIQKSLEEQEIQIQHITSVLQNAVRTKGDQRISAYQSFDKLHANKGTVVEDLVETTYVEWEGSQLTLEEYKKGTELLEKQVAELEDLVKEMEAVIPDVVRVDEEAEITGSKRFVGDVSGSTINAFSVNLQTAAGLNVHQLQKDVYRLDKPQTIKGTLSFEQPLTILGNLEVEGTVNGIDISKDVMTTNTVQTSEASMVFKNKLVIEKDLHITGKLNDIDISEEVITLGGTHKIMGKKSFLNGIIADNVKTNLLDGVDINAVYDKAFTKSRSEEVPGTKTFSGGLVTNNIVLQGYINGYNITELADSIVRIDRQQYITGHKTFMNDVTVQDSLTVGGKVNGLHIPDDLFLADVSQTVEGFKDFDGTVTAQHVVVSGTVDDLYIPEDIVTLTRDEEVTSTLNFTQGIDVASDIIVDGLIDGVDIEEVAKQALKLNETHEFNNAVFMGPVTIKDDLVVEGLVNKINLKEIVGDIIFKDEDNVVVESKKSFKKVVADTVRLGHMINGFNIDVDFMKVHGDQVINGTKTFKRQTVFNSLDIKDGMIGNVDVTKLYEDRITLIMEDDIKEDIQFSDDVIVGDLIVYGTVGGLRIPEDIVLKNSTKPIANKVFTNLVKVDNLIVDGKAEVSGLFGGLHLEQFFHDRATLTGDQTIQGDVWIGNSSANYVELSGLLNGMDIAKFADNVMSRTKDQVVYAEKEFTGKTVVLGPITTKEGVNGIHLDDLNDRAFKLNRDNIVTEPLDFEDITVQNMTIEGFINGINLTRLDKESLKKRGDVQYVTGETTFEAGFYVDGDIGADTVNGLVLTEHVLLKSLPQTITGQFTIQNLNVAGNLNVDGLVNGLDLSEIKPRLARIDQERIIESNVTFEGPVHVYHDIQVSGLVNGIDMKRLSDNILMREGDQTIKGNKILRGNITIKGDVDVEYLNGVHWKSFLADVVRTDVHQKIRFPKTFTLDTEVKNAFAGVATVGLVNGRSLEDLIKDVVFVDVPTNITGHKTFKHSVEIAEDMNAERINGLRLRNDVITLMCSEEGPQVITGQKTFENLTVYGDIHVAKTVNSYNLYDLYSDSLLIEGDQDVLGKKTFIEEVQFLKNVFPDSVNGMKLQRDLITLDTDQEIPGPLVFTEDVFVKSNLHVQGLVNGVNIAQLAKEAVYLDTNDTIQGPYHIQTAKVTNDVAVDGYVNGMDLPVFDRNVSDFWNEASGALGLIDGHSSENCKMAKYLQDVLSKSFYILDGFVVHQEFGYPASYMHTSTANRLSLVYLDDSLDDSAATVITIWNSTLKSFVPTEEVRTHFKKNFVTRLGNMELEIRLGIYERSSFVIFNGVPLNISAGFHDAAVLVNEDQRGAIITLLFPSRGICECYRLTLLQDGSRLQVEEEATAPVGKDSTSIAVFRIQNTTYLAVSKLHKPPYVNGFSKIFGRENNAWTRIQSIGIAASSYVKHFFYHNYHYLAFTSVAPVHETREPKSIQIFRNSGPNPQQFSLFQKVPFDDAKGLEIFEFGDLSELYLTTWNETRIQVFRMEGESGLRTGFTLHGKCIKDVKVLSVEGGIYLAVGQQNLKSDNPVSSVLYKGLTKGLKYTPHNFTHC